MSVWKRGFLEITAEILNCLKEGSYQKTQICSKCKLDSRVVKKYLQILQTTNLIKPLNGDSISFTLTEKGVKYLDRFNSFIEMIEQDLQNLPLKQLI